VGVVRGRAGRDLTCEYTALLAADGWSGMLGSLCEWAAELLFDIPFV